MSAKFVAPKVQVVDSNCGGGPGACSIAKQKADIADAMEYRNMQGGNTAVERVGLVDNASTQHANANIKKIMEAGEQLQADAKFDGDVNVVKGGGKGKKVKKGGDDKVYNVVTQSVPDDLYNRIKNNDTSKIDEDIKTLTNIYLNQFKGSDTYPTAENFIDALFEGTENYKNDFHNELLRNIDNQTNGGGLLKLLGLKKSKKSPKKKAAKKTKKVAKKAKKAAKKATKKVAKKTKKVAKKAKKAPKKAAKKKTKKAAKKGKK
jgi:hypothetical protein